MERKMDINKEQEIEQINRILEQKMPGYPVPEALHPSFTNKVWQKIYLRQRQIAIYRVIKFASAAVFLMALGIFMYMQLPVTQGNKFNTLMTQSVVPQDTAGKIQLFSQLIGMNNFSISFDRVNNGFCFVSAETPKNLNGDNGQWKTKLQMAADKCFPDIWKFDCIVADGKGKKWSLLQ